MKKKILWSTLSTRTLRRSYHTQGGLRERWVHCFLTDSELTSQKSIKQSHLPQKPKTLENLNQNCSESSWEQWEAQGKSLQVQQGALNPTEPVVWHTGLCHDGYFEIHLRGEDSVASRDALRLWQNGSSRPYGPVFRVSLKTSPALGAICLAWPSFVGCYVLPKMCFFVSGPQFPI